MSLWLRQTYIIPVQFLITALAATCLTLLIAWPKVPGHEERPTHTAANVHDGNTGVVLASGSRNIAPPHADNRRTDNFNDREREATRTKITQERVIDTPSNPGTHQTLSSAFDDLVWWWLYWTYACLDCVSLRILIAIVVTWFGFRWLTRILIWYQLRDLRDNPNGYNEGYDPLPSQRVALDSICGILVRTSADRPGPIVGLRGTWGSGKSSLLRLLPRSLAELEKREIAVVYVNIWREESQHDLHLEIVRQIASHPRILARCLGVLSPRFVFAPSLGSLRKMLPDGLHLKMDFKTAAMDACMTFPMFWQEVLERIVDGYCKKDRRIVVVLDEIDRADPPMAQAAVMLARRALELHGVSVIIPFVPEQIAYKVFNPLECYSPDLASSMFAELALSYPLSEADIQKPDETPKRIQQIFSYSKSGVEKGGAPSSRAAPLHEYMKPSVERTLALRFLGPSSEAAEARQLRQKRLREHFQDKYISTFVEVPNLIASDIAWLIVRSHTEIFIQFRDLLVPWKGISEHIYFDIIESHIRSLIEKQEARYKDVRVTARQFQGSLVHISTYFRTHWPDSHRDSECMDADLWLSIIVAAYLRAYTRCTSAVVATLPLLAR